MNLNEPLSRFIFNGSSIIGIFSVHKINILEMMKIVILGLDPGIQASLSCLDSLVKPGNDKCSQGMTLFFISAPLAEVGQFF